MFFNFATSRPSSPPVAENDVNAVLWSSRVTMATFAVSTERVQIISSCVCTRHSVTSAAIASIDSRKISASIVAFNIVTPYNTR